MANKALHTGGNSAIGLRMGCGVGPNQTIEAKKKIAVFGSKK